MILFTGHDRPFLTHVVDIMRDLLLTLPDEYTSRDRLTVDMLEILSQMTTSAVVTDGSECSEWSQKMMFRSVVGAEMDNWVPNASQRLLRRAAAALGQYVPPVPTEEDHGPERGSHPLIPDWVCGTYVMRCATCGRLFFQG